MTVFSLSSLYSASKLNLKSACALNVTQTQVPASTQDGVGVGALGATLPSGCSETTGSRCFSVLKCPTEGATYAARA